MYIGFISYNSGEHYSWICKDWKEMYEFCKSDIQVCIPQETPKDIEDKNYFAFINSIICEDCVNDDGIQDEDSWMKDDSWVSIGKASDYSLNQIKAYNNGK